MISRWENGAKGIGSVNLKKAADVYGVSVNDFYEDDEPEQPKAMTESLEALPVF
jgi:transcriptional regulator with XRE-family HTH domain